MSGNYEIELSAPSVTRCDCCGGTTVRLTRFVTRDGDACAVYYAAYSNNHPENEIAMLVSVGEWHEGSKPAQRSAFYCRVRPVDGSYEVMLGDASASAWRDARLTGQKLSRQEALVHPAKATVFEIVDAAFLDDPSLRGFVQRVGCGDAAVPLEKSFRMPDVVFALGPEVSSRATLSRSFVSLDDQRFFVRCLLPVPVEGHGRWCIGLWVELSKADYDHTVAVWDRRGEYSRLRFKGAIANDIVAELDIPVRLGAPVEVHVPEVDAPPMVCSSPDEDVSSVLSRKWSSTEFEQYAVSRGFL